MSTAQQAAGVCAVPARSHGSPCPPVSSARRLHGECDAEVAAVIKSYSGGHHTPCARTPNVAATGVTTTTATTNGATASTSSHADAVEGTFLMEVADGEGRSAAGLASAHQGSGHRGEAPAASMRASPKRKENVETGARGVVDVTTCARRDSLSTDTVHLAHVVRVEQPPTSSASSLFDHSASTPRRAHTYAAGAVIGSGPAGEENAKRVYSYAAVTQTPHRVYDADAVQRLLEEKEKRLREVSAAHHTEASCERKPVTVSETIHSTVSPAAHVAATTAGAAIRVPTKAPPQDDAPWLRAPSSPSRRASRPSQRLPMGSREDAESSASASLRVGVAPTLSENSGTAYPLYTAKMAAAHGSAGSQPSLYYTSMPAMPVTYPSLSADPSGAFATSAQDHYMQYMWSCALYYEQCMAAVQSTMLPLPACAPVMDASLAFSTLSPSTTTAAAGIGSWGPPGTTPGSAPPQSYNRAAEATAPSPSAAQPAEVSWTAPSADITFRQTVASAVHSARPSHPFFMTSAPTSQAPFSAPADDANAGPFATIPRSGFVTVLPVPATTTHHPPLSLVKSNNSSEMNMNFVAATSVNSISDAAATPSRGHRRRSSHPSHSHTGSRPQKQKGTAAVSKSSPAAAPCTAAGSTSSLTAGSTHRPKSRNASTLIPPAMRYSQTNPFSTYEHNKKLVSSATAAHE